MVFATGPSLFIVVLPLVLQLIFVSSSGTFPVVVVVTAAAVLVLTFTFYFSIYTFRPLQLHCFIAFFATFFNTKFI